LILFKIDVFLNALGKKDQVNFSLDDLKRHDPALTSLIQEIFPCDNVYISKCKSSRGKHLEVYLNTSYVYLNEKNPFKKNLSQPKF